MSDAALKAASKLYHWSQFGCADKDPSVPLVAKWSRIIDQAADEKHGPELTRLREVERLAGELAEQRIKEWIKVADLEPVSLTLARTLKAKIEEGKP